MGIGEVTFDEIEERMKKPEYVYVASSWRNPFHIAVCAALKAAGIDHYNFKDSEGFRWSEVMPNWHDRVGGTEGTAPMKEYLAALEHPRSHEGFHRDFDALQRCDACVLVLPCNRSAHLELGWAVGQGKRTAVLLDPQGSDEEVTPELMYKMCDYIAPSLFDLLGWLGVED